MSTFKTGDKIEVQLYTGWVPRLFLAEHAGRVYYRKTGGSDSFDIDASKVRAPQPPPPPFKVGDRIRRTGHAYDRHVIHVDCMRVVVAYYDTADERANTTEFTAADAHRWRLVSGAQHWTSPTGQTYNLSSAYRDQDGDVWTFTGGLTDTGAPMAKTPGLGPRSIVSADYVYGPLTEVPA